MLIKSVFFALFKYRFTAYSIFKIIISVCFKTAPSSSGSFLVFSAPFGAILPILAYFCRFFRFSTLSRLFGRHFPPLPPFHAVWTVFLPTPASRCSPDRISAPFPPFRAVWAVFLPTPASRCGPDGIFLVFCLFGAAQGSLCNIARARRYLLLFFSSCAILLTR